MKKKFKLFATIGSLCLAVAMMTVGVLAATAASLTVTSSVQFTIEEGQEPIYVTIDGAVTGNDTVTGFSYKNYKGEAGSSNSEDKFYVNGESEGNGVTSHEFGDDEARLTVTEASPSYQYQFTITNTGAADVYVTITASETADTLNYWNGEEAVSGTSNATAADGTTAVAAGKTLVYTYTYTLSNFSQSSTADVQFVIALSNTATSAD